MFRKVVAGLVKADINQFVGEQGNIFFDTVTGEFRLSDGSTPGGIPLGGGGGGGIYVLPTAGIGVNGTLGGVKVDGTTIKINTGTGVIRGFSGNYADLTNTPTPYALPIATTQSLGGIKVGAGLQIDPATGVMNATNAVAQLTVSEISGVSTITNQVNNVSKIRFDKDTGFKVQDLGAGEIKVSLGSSFKTWKVAGQQDLVAQAEDTIELKAGTGIALTTDPSSNPKSLTVSAKVASNTQLGVVKEGTNVNITNDGTLNVPKGAGINKIVDISDVNSTNLANGDVLVYNAGGQRWDTTTELFDQNFDAGEY